ncbi:MAG: helix-hairpin-helix domain-containing protein [Nanoarchaeota archaeon]|nr:helix-hairpin-helix domain-containing protein [Nanoarchaeota archaeon]
MNTFEKARILGEAGGYDSCGPKMCEVNVREGLGGIYYAKAEHKTYRIFKTLMENNCSFDCKYCANAAGCKKNKAAYEPEELAKLFMHLNKNLAVDGLFLSSAVSGNPDRATEKMLESVRLVRHKYGFKGYVHFKVLPGTSYELVKQASEMSNRMSVNIETPNKTIMSELSSCKDYKIDILKRQAWILKMNLRSGQTTQMILNCLSTDKDVLKMMKWEYEQIKIKRMYFSAFRPVKGTLLENEKAEPEIRQNRLYNVDFLIRDYHFNFKDFNQVMNEGMLPREDPKLALAKATFDKPIDINEASYEELIRIPGIGPTTAKKIIQGNKIKKYEDLHKLGGWINRAKPFIEIEGKRQKMLMEY